jgi:hypothetical protein
LCLPHNSNAAAAALPQTRSARVTSVRYATNPLNLRGGATFFSYALNHDSDPLQPDSFRPIPAPRTPVPECGEFSIARAIAHSPDPAKHSG